MDILQLLIDYQKPPNNIIFPFYHIISNIDPPHIVNLFKVKNPIQFEKELDQLLQYFQPLSLEQVYDYQLQGTQPNKPSFHLTIDDGLMECHTVIAPILKKKSVPATFFINPKFIDNQNLMYRYKQSLILEKMKLNKMIKVAGFSPDEILKFGIKDSDRLDKIAKSVGINFNHYLTDYQPYMTWAQLKELQNDGFAIGGHSNNHPYYKEINYDAQINETVSCMQSIEEHLNPKVRSFAFPFTDDGVSKNFFEEVHPSLDICFTTAGIKTDIYPWVHNRFSMEKGKKPIENNYLKWAVKNTIGVRHINTHSY